MEDGFSVVQTEPGRFCFESDNGKSHEIELYISKGTLADKELLLKTGEARFEVLIPGIDYRPLFIIKEQEREYITAERTLPVEGMNNFRDMGGYETCDGRTVKWGALYRSDHLYNATEKGVEYLNKLGIRTIVDYRSKDEADKYPNKMLSDGVETYRLDPDAHTAELSAQFTSSKADEDRNLINKIIEQKEKGSLVNRYDIVMEQYYNFAHKGKSKEAFARLLKIASNPSAAAIVQHCRGGKDRTGFGSALLLGVLGVKREYLVFDYMLTYTNRIVRNNDKMEGYKKLTDDPEVLAYLYSLIETKPEFIEASIQAMEEQFGSIEEYAIKELGITKEEVETLKALYLE